MGGKGKKGQRFLVVTGVVVLLIVVAVVVVTTVQQSGLAEKVDAARKVGYPFEGKSLEVNPPFPNAKNAAPYYEKAIGLYRSLPSRPAAETALGKRADDRDEKERTALTAFVKDMGPALDYAWKGAQTDYCYFPKDWEKGANVLFPEYASLKQIARILSFRAQGFVADGDIQSAVQDFATVRALARHITELPTLIALLVAIAIDAIGVRAIEEIFPLVLKGGSHSKWMRQHVEAMPVQWDITRMLRTEAFFGWWLTDHMREFESWVGPDGGGADWKLALMSKSAYVARATKSATLDLYMPALTGYTFGDDERMTLEALDERMERIAATDRIAGTFVSFGTPLFSGVANALDRARFRRSSLLAALDVLDHRREKGAWPSALPPGYIDPYDGKPLRYRVDGDGFRIWAVGSDLTDDGGKSQREAKGGAHDEVFIFPRPNP